MNRFINGLRKAKSLPEIFELVKDSVRIILRKERIGLMLGLTDMGSGMEGFVGAFYPVGSNIIVMNKTPLRRIKETDPKLFKPYVFHILLHEYLHTLGFLDEDFVRIITYEICRRVFGESHTVTQMSRNLSKFLPNLVYPVWDWKDSNQLEIELVDDFDHSSINYIG
jgi:hypothetical protein